MKTGAVEPFRAAANLRRGGGKRIRARGEEIEMIRSGLDSIVWRVGQGAAVVRAEGDARAMRLHLANGMTAPVARSAVAHLRSLGWLEKAGGAR